jgi:hypothetical protein
VAKTNVKDVSNDFKLESLNKETQVLFEKIFATKRFESRKKLANKVFAQGVHCLAEKYLSNNKLKKDIELLRISRSVEDSNVTLMILERLVTSLYNIKLAELLGKTVSVEEVSNGLFTELPTELKQVQDEMLNLRIDEMESLDE